jgi:cysteine desulfurase
MEDSPIYFDYMATTPIDQRVLDEMMKYMGPVSCFGNPSSTTHSYGRVAAVAVEHARAHVAELISASPEDIVFTSGATEANNLAIIGAATFYQRKGRHLVTMITEHKSVLDTFKYLEKQGFEVSYVKPDQEGLLSVDALEEVLRDDTILVSMMHVNNEIGVIQDIAKIGQKLREKGILFHVDAAQSAGKLPIDLRELPVSLMSFSAHKLYGPKGVGALYVRHKPRVRLNPQSYGGGHEGGLRSGTLATHQIVGMGEACRVACLLYREEQDRVLVLRNALWAGIKSLPGISINGSFSQRIPGNLNIRFDRLNNQNLVLALRGLAFSTTSACVSEKAQPSYVLRALGLNAVEAQSAVRLSFGRFTTENDIQRAIVIFCQQIPLLYDALDLEKS